MDDLKIVTKQEMNTEPGSPYSDAFLNSSENTKLRVS